MLELKFCLGMHAQHTGAIARTQRLPREDSRNIEDALQQLCFYFQNQVCNNGLIT